MCFRQLFYRNYPSFYKYYLIGIGTFFQISHKNPCGRFLFHTVCSSYYRFMHLCPQCFNPSSEHSDSFAFRLYFLSL